MRTARQARRPLTTILAVLLLPLGVVALLAGPAGAATGTFSYTGGPVDIPDAQIVSVPFPHGVPGQASITATASGLTGTISKVTVKLGDGTCGITHTYDHDLKLYLLSPGGTSIELADQVGGDGDNFCQTVFDDSAATAISSGSAPFTGTFRPRDALSAFAGESGNGTWQLTATDNSTGDTGTLHGFSVTITTVSSVPATLTGPATATGVVGDAFSYTPTVGGNPAPTVTLNSGSLPPGLVLDAATGAITGTPTGDGGVYAVQLKADNGIGTPATLDLTITIDKPDVTGLAPSITGLAKVGQTLTANAGSPSPADSSLSYVWLADGNVIAGANGSTLYLDRDLAGSRIQVRITASHDGYDPETETSDATPYVRALVNRPKVTVSPGTVSRGGSVTVLGQGLVPGARYQIRYLDSVVNRTADEYGEIHYELGLPSNAPTGTNLVTLSGVSPVTVVTATFTVRSGGVVVG